MTTTFTEPFRQLVYLVGAPAAGKSTVMAALTAGCTRHLVSHPITHDVLRSARSGQMVGAELGRRRPRFAGTDALPMNVSPAACAWLESGFGPLLLLGEGDRLAHARFFAAAAAGGYTVTLGYLEAPAAVLEERCARRGSTQNDAWRRGRATKAARLAELASAGGTRVVPVDATAHPKVVAAWLVAAIPALRALPEVT